MKKLMLILFIVVIIISLSSCNLMPEQENYDYEGNATQIENDMTYYNTFLGIEFTAPKGWWQYVFREENFSSDPTATESDESFDKLEGNGFVFIELMAMASKQYSTETGHIEIAMSADINGDSSDINDYIQKFEAAMLMEDNSEKPASVLVSAGDITLGGTAFKNLLIERNDGERTYYIETFTTPVNERFYMTVFVNYSLDNNTAHDEVTALLDTNLKITLRD